MVISEVRHWYQRPGVWLAASLAAIVIVPLLGVASSLDPLDGIGQSVLAIQALLISALIPGGMWMGALVARRSWAQAAFSLFTLLFIVLAAWAIWNFVVAVEAEAENECFLIETAAPDVVDQLDEDLCASLTDGGLDALQRWTWGGFLLVWVVPMFLLYFLRRRFLPG